jgi:hypothetical protein
MPARKKSRKTGRSKFTRSLPQGQSRNTRDDRGTVRVVISLYNSKGPMKGNRSRSFTLNDTRVSAVYKAMTKKLF